MTQDGGSLFSWLHLSDIHFGHGNRSTHAQRTMVLDRLMGDVQKAIRLGAPSPQAVFITGDIGFSGDSLGRGEYAQAAEWLRKLAGKLELSLHDIYLVPGNHDVARVQPANDRVFELVSSLRMGKRNLDDAIEDWETRRLLSGRLERFLQLSKQFGPRNDSATVTTDNLFWKRRIETRDGLPIRLVGLNTTLLANDDSDHGQLRLGLVQIHRAFEDLSPEEVVIVLGHHPPEWLSKDESKEMDPLGWLQTRAHLLLTGHVHEQGSVLTHPGGGRRFVHVFAGASHAASGPNEPPVRYTFNFGALHLEPGRPLQLRFWPFIWTPKHKEFRPDQENLPSNFTRSPHEPFLVHELAHTPSARAWSSPKPEAPVARAPTASKAPEQPDTRTVPPQPEQAPQPIPAPTDSKAPEPNTRIASVEPEQAPRPVPHKEAKAEQQPPKKGISPARVLAALALVVGGSGILLQNASNRASKQAPPGVATPRVVESPLIMGNGVDALVELRQQHRVRPLQSSETTRTASVLPDGVLGFVPSSSLLNVRQSVIQQVQTQDTVEVHKTSTGSLHLVGFIRESDSQFLISGAPTTLTLSPKLSGPFQTVASIPIDRLKGARLIGLQGQRLVELRVGTSSAAK